MMRKSLFTTVAVLGMLSAIASQPNAQQRSLAKAPTQPHHPIGT